MGLFGNDTLKFDVADIVNMRNKIEEIVEELAARNEKMLKAFDQIKEEWNTPAGKKFTKNMNTDWAEDVKKYITVLNAVNDLLKIAQDEYSDLEQEARGLRF